MKIGAIYEMALCGNCGKDIEHEYWGDGGALWIHSETRMSDCRRSPQAKPRTGTTRPVGDPTRVS